MTDDLADSGEIGKALQCLSTSLDAYLQFDHPDALDNAEVWRNALQRAIPERGIGLHAVLNELSRYVIPNGSSIPRPGSTAFITTGAVNVGVLANLASNIASPQRAGLTAFNALEEISLDWMAEMFQLNGMKGIYSSGGSVANLLALGAARQACFEKEGIDVASDGFSQTVRVYTSRASHHTIQRSLAVLGCGRNAVCIIDSDRQGRMLPSALRTQLQQDKTKTFLPMAVVANAGTTARGAIDPIGELASIAKEHNVWLHVDGAYGLPGILDPQISELYTGIDIADSVIVDPHKWLGAPVGIGATFVRDRNLLFRAFTQGESDYLEGSLSNEKALHSLDKLGIPWFDLGVELSAPARGAVVWALIREIGVTGLRERICRHNNMARKLAEKALAHPKLELLQTPTLSICCFRYIDNKVKDLNELNKVIHRQLVHNNVNIPSTAIVNGQLAIRPCFIGARTSWQQVDDLFNEVIEIGENLTKGYI